MKRIIIKVYGHVQGVFFRYSTRKIARRLGLTGFVKNMPDGSVYIVSEGHENKLKELLKFSKKGPEHAWVEKVEFDYKEPKHEYVGFEYLF